MGTQQEPTGVKRLKNLDSHIHAGPKKRGSERTCERQKFPLPRLAGSQSMASNPEVEVHSYRNYEKNPSILHPIFNALHVGIL